MLNPRDLAPHYSRFRVADRLLLTGHSHQAWPDAAFEGQQQAWLEAAEYVDRKWERAAERAERVSDGWRRLLGEPAADLAFGQNTHELIVRWLSALPLAERPRLVTTDGEFHTIRRQTDRLREAGFDVVVVPSRPAETLAERLADTVDDRTAAVLVSSVLFETSEIVPGLDHVARACSHAGAELLVDAYHHLNVVPFDIGTMGLDRAFVVGGGYKYCQLGEGNAFLRVPPGCTLRPVITGWYAEFHTIAERHDDGRVAFGEGAARFAGATYDPTAHYRAAAVFAFHQTAGCSVKRLRALSLHQASVLVQRIAAADFDPRCLALEPIAPERRAGFVALTAADAPDLARRLNDRGVWCDARGMRLRLGPAPYVTDDQLRAAVDHLVEVVRHPA